MLQGSGVIICHQGQNKWQNSDKIERCRGELYPCETDVRLCDELETDEEVEVDMESDVLTVLRTGKQYPLKPIGDVSYHFKYHHPRRLVIIKTAVRRKGVSVFSCDFCARMLWCKVGACMLSLWETEWLLGSMRAFDLRAAGC